MGDRYVVGDIHGCFDTFERLLDDIRFGKDDELWIVGDLVNRGSDSVGVLDWVLDHSDQVECVLGNHDFHLLAVARGCQQMREEDIFEDILDSPRLDDYVSWYRQRPLFVRDSETAMVHAGVWPEWRLEKLEALSREVEQILQSEQLDRFLSDVYGNEPKTWSDDLYGIERLRFIVNACTRMRVLGSDGRMRFDFSGPPKKSPTDAIPWYGFGEPVESTSLFFGHWSAHGYGRTRRGTCLDSACVWGGALTAVRVSDGEVFSVESDRPRVFD